MFADHSCYALLEKGVIIIDMRMKYVRPVALGTALALGYGVVKLGLNEEKEHIGSIGSIPASPNIAMYSSTATVSVLSPAAALDGPGLAKPTDRLYHVYINVG